MDGHAVNTTQLQLTTTDYTVTSRLLATLLV